MKHTIRYWFTKKKLMMAQMHDLQRQLQEAWDRCDELITDRALMAQENDWITDQLHRVAMEREDERERRLKAEAALIEFYLDKEE